MSTPAPAGAPADFTPPREMIDEFRSLTDVNPNIATFYLRLAGGDIAAAIEAYFTNPHLATPPPPIPRFPHPGSWTNCGGNPLGMAASAGGGTCTSLCNDCGAHTHWTCCGSAERGSLQCPADFTREQANSNVAAFLAPRDPGALVLGRATPQVVFPEVSLALAESAAAAPADSAAAAAGGGGGHASPPPRARLPFNRDGYRMFPSPNSVPAGGGPPMLYCKRNLGPHALPGSQDGRCGPTTGPQCPSCKMGAVYVPPLNSDGFLQSPGEFNTPFHNVLYCGSLTGPGVRCGPKGGIPCPPCHQANALRSGLASPSCGVCQNNLLLAPPGTWGKKQAWQCDSKKHKGKNKFGENGPASPLYGCHTVLKCDWGLCGSCYTRERKTVVGGSAALPLPDPDQMPRPRTLCPEGHELLPGKGGDGKPCSSCARNFPSRWDSGRCGIAVCNYVCCQECLEAPLMVSAHDFYPPAITAGMVVRRGPDWLGSHNSEDESGGVRLAGVVERVEGSSNDQIRVQWRSDVSNPASGVNTMSCRYRPDRRDVFVVDLTNPLARPSDLPPPTPPDSDVEDEDEEELDVCALCYKSIERASDKTRHPSGSVVHKECNRLSLTMGFHGLMKGGGASSEGGGSSGAAAVPTSPCTICGLQFEPDDQVVGGAHDSCRRVAELERHALERWSLRDPAPSTKKRDSAAPPPSKPPALRRDLSGNSRVALNVYKSVGTAPSATGLAMAEELLTRGSTLLDAATKRSLRQAVASRELGLAGMLLLGGTLTYRPSTAPPNNSAAASGGGGADAQQPVPDCGPTCPVCYDSLDDAPGGVVGCLSGHALHAACASSLCLGGGLCPECREPLFFAQVTAHDNSVAAEKESALLAAKALETEKIINDENAEMRPSPSSGIHYCGRIGVKGLGPGGAFQVGDRVQVRQGYRSVSDAKSGPLRPGDSGIVKSLSGDWHRGGSMNIEAQTGKQIGKTWNYSKPALRHYRLPDHERAVLQCGPNQGRPCKSCRKRNKEMSSKNPAARLVSMQMNRLRIELSTVQAARTEVQERFKALLERRGAPPAPGAQPPVLRRELTQTSQDLASGELLSEVHIADVQRCRRLLALAALWGDTPTAKAARAKLHQDVRNGQVDTVARSVRERNAELVWEAACWEDAVIPTGNWVVTTDVIDSDKRKVNTVPLRFAPRFSSPLSGFELTPGERFTSSQERIDSRGRIWAKLAIPPLGASPSPPTNSAAPNPEGFFCPAGHLTVLLSDNARFNCDVCGDGFSSPRKSCTLCSYDICDPCRLKVRDPELWTVVLQPIGRAPESVDSALADRIRSAITGPLGEVFQQWPRAGWGNGTTFEKAVTWSLSSAEKVVVCARNMDDEEKAERLREKLESRVAAFNLEPVKVKGYSGYGYPDRGYDTSGQRLDTPKQGWVCVTPAGIATLECCSRTGDGPRCYGCGGDIVVNSKMKNNKSFSDVAVGDRVIHASTMTPLIVTGFVDRANDFGDKVAGGGGKSSVGSSGKFHFKTLGMAVIAANRFKKAGAEPAKPEPEGNVQRLLEELEASLAAKSSGLGGDEASSEKSNVFVECRPDLDGEEWDPEDCAFYRQEELLLSTTRNQDLRIFRGKPHTRKEVFMLLNDEKAARKEWAASKKVDVCAPSGKDFASCVRGHLLHSHCFQAALINGKGCPSCSEPLWVPKVERRRPEAGELACPADHGQDDLTRAIAAVGDVEAAARAQQPLLSGRGALVEGHILRMCPICCSSPLQNKNCADLRRHHGECSKCSAKLENADATIAAALARVGGKVTVADVIPQCAKCKVPVQFNGCQSCGHLFAGSGDGEWERLPIWDPNAAAALDLDLKAREAARLLAAQVRSEAAHLAHERLSLAQAEGEDKGDAIVHFARARPPPPKPGVLTSIGGGSATASWRRSYEEGEDDEEEEDNEEEEQEEDEDGDREET